MAIQNLKVNNYFLKSIACVFIDRGSYQETLKAFLEHRYQNMCYYDSVYAIIGLRETDKLVRGSVNMYRGMLSRLLAEVFPGAEIPKVNYEHGWIEFYYQGKWYVFDNLLDSIVTRQEYRIISEPIVQYKLTKKRLLEIYTSKAHATKEGNIYHVKELKPERTNTAIPFSNATIELDENQKVKKFTAYLPY